MAVCPTLVEVDAAEILTAIWAKNALRREAGLPLRPVRETFIRELEQANWRAFVAANYKTTRLRVLGELRDRHGEDFGYSSGGRWAIEARTLVALRASFLNLRIRKLEGTPANSYLDSATTSLQSLALREDGMATVNLDALLPREDFEVTKADVHNWQHSLTLKIEELEAKKITYNTLCKPDFQRETASWDSAKIVDLIRSYLNGDLIPAIILWRSQAGKIFVIDGAHRLSALIAWVQDDYGDKEKSLGFFQNQIPSEQLNAAKRTRQAIENSIGTYAQHTRAFEHPETTRVDIMDRARRMASLALQLQWVPDSDPQKAEDSFFKINQSAQAIEPTELRILRSRDAPNALAARVIVRSATGHQYWRRFPDAVKPRIEISGRSIFKILFEPEIDTPIKNLNLPFAGRSGQSLSHIFDLVNLANDVPVIDSTKKQATIKIKDDTRPPPDVDGTHTAEFLSRTLASGPITVARTARV